MRDGNVALLFLLLNRSIVVSLPMRDGNKTEEATI